MQKSVPQQSKAASKAVKVNDKQKTGYIKSSDEDIFNEDSKEDQEIMKSIEFAEKQLNHKMTGAKQESSGL